MPPERLAVYATAYPAAEPFLDSWVASVRAQQDRDFDLWIGVDGLEIEVLQRALGDLNRVQLMKSVTGATPARVRATAIKQLVKQYDAVVFVDVDDELEPSRIAAARAWLRHCDVVACRLRIMDHHGRDLGLLFGPEQGEDPCSFLPRWNVYGLSNVAYRAEALAACLPVADHCTLVDWLLATRAWLAGASLGFDLEPRMRYRQYAGNTARVVGPFTSAGVRAATRLVRGHYHYVLQGRSAPEDRRYDEILQARERVERFGRWAGNSAQRWEQYVTELNAIPRRYVWWWSVAHPDLEDLWRA